MKINKKQKFTIIIAAVLIIAVFIYWQLSGGVIFTKTQILIEKKDELFGTTYKEWQDKLVWGLDYTLIATAVIILISGILFFIFKKKAKDESIN